MSSLVRSGDGREIRISGHDPLGLVIVQDILVDLSTYKHGLDTNLAVNTYLSPGHLDFFWLLLEWRGDFLVVLRLGSLGLDEVRALGCRRSGRQVFLL